MLHFDIIAYILVVRRPGLLHFHFHFPSATGGLENSTQSRTL